jgi:hypothetical protein
VEQRYGALRLISTVNKVCGWLVIVIGGITALVAMSAGHVFPGILALIACAFLGLILIASGQIIHVIIDIEDNTRTSSVLMKSIQRASITESDHALSNTIGLSTATSPPEEITSTNRSDDTIGSDIEITNVKQDESSDLENEVNLAINSIRAKGLDLSITGLHPNMIFDIRQSFGSIRIRNPQELIEYARNLRD